MSFIYDGESKFPIEIEIPENIDEIVAELIKPVPVPTDSEGRIIFDEGDDFLDETETESDDLHEIFDDLDKGDI